ncbi:MAG: DNA repair protein RadA [bacterium]
MSKSRIKYICSNCGFESLKWLGRCPTCEEWNSFSEEIVETGNKNKSKVIRKVEPQKLEPNIEKDEARIQTGIEEFDRVLGGGLMPGSVVLIGGDPGIGKSTLVMQAASLINGKTLYVTGEESIRQINIRAKRLNVRTNNLFVLAETNIDVILETIENSEPLVVIVDSIQTVYKEEFENAPGTVTQIRECTMQLLQHAKTKGCAIIIVGHVTKEGFIAGPKVLEHIVDTVLQFEGERNHSYRILRAQKNRFGGTNEIGIFEMHDNGLTEVKNPSEIFLSGRGDDVTGSVVTASIEGTRPVLLEVQALVTPSSYGNPQRVATGFDYRRLSILLAVLEKRAGLRLSSANVFVNMAGGLRIDEPAVDLAVCCSIASSMMDKSSAKSTVVIGEVGLGGEIRGVGHIEKRIQEAAKLGFERIIIPNANTKSLKTGNGIKIIAVENIVAAIDKVLG